MGRFPDIEEYAQEVLNIKLTRECANMLRLLDTPPYRVLCTSGHSVGKTCAAAIKINHWFDTYEPSAVISTAPTKASVEQVLWSEVRLQRLRVGLPDVFRGERMPMMWTSEDHWAVGLTANKGESLHGRHRERMLFVMDECVGIASAVWTVFSSMFKPEQGHAWLAICNPTDTTCEAYMQSIHYRPDGKPMWHLVALSALDHPNIKAELAGLPPPIPNAVTLAQVRDWITRWCTEIVSPHEGQAA